MDFVIIQAVDHRGEDTFMCLSGERIDSVSETDDSVYPFGHAVTLRLSPDSAARVGQDTITVSETEILQDCQLPKETTELPAVETQAETSTKGDPPNKQLTLFGDDTPDPLTLF